MPRVEFRKGAVQKANEEFYLLHPDRKNRPLTQGPGDSELRSEWLKIYSKHAGKSAIKTPKKIPTAPTCPLNKEKKEVYVYLYVAGAGGHGHVGLIIEQKNGIYIRYSQAAENPNLHGWDRYEYLTWLQKVVVRTRIFPKLTPIQSLAPGSKMVRIPTAYPDSIQKAVNQYIADKTHYHVVTNNCADFVNDTINAASDVDVSDRTKPIDYYKQLILKFPNCIVSH